MDHRWETKTRRRQGFRQTGFQVLVLTRFFARTGFHFARKLQGATRSDCIWNGSARRWGGRRELAHVAVAARTSAVKARTEPSSSARRARSVAVVRCDAAELFTKSNDTRCSICCGSLERFERVLYPRRSAGRCAIVGTSLTGSTCRGLPVFRNRWCRCVLMVASESATTAAIARTPPSSSTTARSTRTSVGVSP